MELNEIRIGMKIEHLMPHVAGAPREWRPGTIVDIDDHSEFPIVVDDGDIATVIRRCDEIRYPKGGAE